MWKSQQAAFWPASESPKVKSDPAHYKKMGNMSKQKRLDTRFAWIEASIRYAGKFDKISYGQHFDINPPQISADQAAFVAAINHELAHRETAGEGHDPAPYLDIVKGKIAVLRPLPEPPVFDIPGMREWLEQVVTIPFVKMQDFRRVDPSEGIMRAVCDAILRRRPIRVSLIGKPQGGWRNVSPHSIIEAHGRLHLRGYDHTEEAFTDLLLTRIADTGPHDRGVQYVGQDADIDWQETETVTVQLNPEAGIETARLSIRDFGLTGEKMSRGIPLPRALRHLLPTELGVPAPGAPSEIPPVILRLSLEV